MEAAGQTGLMRPVGTLRAPTKRDEILVKMLCCGFSLIIELLIIRGIGKNYSCILVFSKILLIKKTYVELYISYCVSVKTGTLLHNYNTFL